ncbi:uncharacterized protein N7458_002479 [Penicillium daleae]|uniref:FAD-binding domain-containing protein n=1 Tax=Penicillium daleae TaxID=63821 RepID=A0AAD6G775_9EURO|nr:uncharacterized protein N7458_002479 [Penicillium daleae]KAJ5460927.1 hypothetical protein N7458_002479 [Penicillium daleae]
MASSPITDVAIIGCGLSGLCVALVLRSYSIPCTIYEKRSTHRQGGSISLFPNSLRILDSLGVYQTIRAHGFPLSTSIIKDESFQTIRTVQVCDEARYGYPLLRIARDAILDVLVAAARERGVEIYFDHRFVSIVPSADDAPPSEPITLTFTNAAPRSAALVVGADGLRSRVRSVTPSFKSADPQYVGQALIAWSVPYAQLRYPVPLSEVPLGMAMIVRRGMVLFVPDDPSGKSVRVAVQLALTHREFLAWKTLGGQRDKLLDILRNGGEQGEKAADWEWPDLVASAIEIAEKDHDSIPIFLWPYFTIPTMETWVAKTDKAVLLGDAAHVFPPTGAQGAGMAIEDAHGLGMALAEAMTGTTDISLALAQWQSWRRQRVQQVTEFSSQVNKSRVALASSGQDRGKAPAEQGFRDDMDWLYGWRSAEQWSLWKQQQEDKS